MIEIFINLNNRCQLPACLPSLLALAFLLQRATCFVLNSWSYLCYKTQFKVFPHLHPIHIRQLLPITLFVHQPPLLSSMSIFTMFVCVCMCTHTSRGLLSVICKPSCSPQGFYLHLQPAGVAINLVTNHVITTLFSIPSMGLLQFSGKTLTSLSNSPENDWGLQVVYVQFVFLLFSCSLFSLLFVHKINSLQLTHVYKKHTETLTHTDKQKPINSFISACSSLREQFLLIFDPKWKIESTGSWGERERGKETERRLGNSGRRKD